MSAQPDPQELRLGCLLVIQNDEASSPLPLERTAVSGQIIGPVARVRVTQQFGNPFSTPIELEYLFPLPHTAAIVDYHIKIGDREIRAEIKEVEVARRAYLEAVEAGQRASLLEQRRPNLFSIRIGNVQPNEIIICELEFEDRLTFQDGTYQFVFPMGITPRYHSPSESLASANSANSPLALPDERIAPVELHLSIDAGTPIAEPTSPSHTLQITRQDAQHLALELAGENLPNKDFVLRYAVSGEALTSTFRSSISGESEIALIMLIPPRLTLDSDPAPREFVFVIDRSGSMSDGPMTQAKNALRACLRALNPRDTFTIQAFDDKIEWFAQPAQEVIQENIDLVDQWLDTIESRGGTEILPAIDEALALPADPERQRYVVFLTDGSVSADEQTLHKIAKQRGSARIFAFGIGPAVNRFLLDKIAQMGRGSAEFIGANEDIETAITRFQDHISYPVLQDIRLNWQDADSWDTYPEIIPDLYVGQPLEIATRLKRKGDAWLHLMGQISGTPVTVDLPLAPAAAENPTIQRLWARARLESLLDQQRRDSDQEKIRQQIISLSLEHRLLTPFTAFVAIDSEITSGGEAKPIRVSTPLPEGLNYESFFGRPGVYVGGTSGGIPAPAPSSVRYSLAAPSAPAQQSVPHESSIDIPTFLRKRNQASSSQYYEGNQKQSMDRSLEDSEMEDGVFTTLSAGEAEIEEVAAQSPDFNSIDERIKWLARTQKVNGSWNDDIEMTAAALLAFVRAGHTTHSGSYRQQVRKTATWLQGSRTKDFLAFVTVRALRELQDAVGNDLSIAVQFPVPTTDLERAIAGNPAIIVPTSITSLDDLRVAALAVGNVQPTAQLRQEARQELVQVWLALGKPL